MVNTLSVPLDQKTHGVKCLRVVRGYCLDVYAAQGNPLADCNAVRESLWQANLLQQRFVANDACIVFFREAVYKLFVKVVKVLVRQQNQGNIIEVLFFYRALNQSLEAGFCVAAFYYRVYQDLFFVKAHLEKRMAKKMNAQQKTAHLIISAIEQNIK